MMNIQKLTGFIHALASCLATSKFGHIALRGITVADLVLMSVDLWGY
jgi:hypothetical protein